MRVLWVAEETPQEKSRKSEGDPQERDPVFIQAAAIDYAPRRTAMTPMQRDAFPQANERRACSVVVTRMTIVAVAALAIAACGGGGGSSNPTPAGDNPPPPPPPPPVAPLVTVPTDLPVLFIEVSTDTSVFDEVIGEVIEGNEQNFIQYTPATGEAAVVATNRSVSYAESISTLKVFNDRVFVVNVSDTGARIAELNVDDMLEPATSMPIPVPQAQDSVSEACLAVIGNDLIYKVAHRRAPFPATGYSDGPLIRVPEMFGAIGPGAIETLMPGFAGSGTSPSSGGFVTDACRGYFDVDGNDWFDTEVGFAGGQRGYYQKSIATAEPTLLGMLPNQAPVHVSEFAYDDGTAYLAALDTSAQAFAVAWIPVDTGELDVTQAVFVADYAADFTATGLFNVDADDGYVAFVLEGIDRDIVMLLDLETGLYEAFDSGAHINQLQLMFRGS